MARAASALVAFGFLFPLLAAALPSPAAAANWSDPPNLNGVWEDSSFTQFRIHQDAGGTVLSSTMVNDTCKGGPRSTYVDAVLDGISLAGSITRCVGPDDPLVKNCNLSEVWETPFTANYTDGEIVGNLTVQWWVWDVDANGSWVNCTLDHYYDEGFYWDRLDCAVKTFGELAEEHIGDASKRDAAVDLAQAFEDGQTLYWTEGQQAPGGLKQKVDAFLHLMSAWNYTSHINSAYRPLLYQAHFADLRLCAQHIHDVLKSQPELTDAFRASVDALNAEIDKHAIKYSWANVTGLAIRVVYVCYRVPLTGCPHVDERAADISISPDDNKLDWIAQMYGFCRPYLHAKTPDRPHWEFLGPDPFSNPKCSVNALYGTISLSISGNSPVNLLLEAPDGRQIGYDPATQEAVNDFGDYAFYSGPGSEPQRIDIDADEVSLGGYTVTGVGTGAGPYTVSFSALGGDGDAVDAGSVEGTASLGAATTPLHFSVPAQYPGSNPLASANLTASTGNTRTYSVPREGAPQSILANGGAFTGAMYDGDDGVLVFGDDGAGGPTQFTLPTAFLEGPYVVRVDGVAVTPVVSNVNGVTTISFDRPAGGAFITVEGKPTASGPGPSNGAGGAAAGNLTFALLIAALIGAAGAIGFVLWRRARPPAAPPVA